MKFFLHKKRIAAVSILILSLVGMILSISAYNPPKKAPSAKKGVLDLTGWDFDKDGIVKLDGEWEFYWKRLLTYEDFQGKESSPEADGYLKVPGVWNGQIIAGNAIPGEGYATYRLKIKTNRGNVLNGLKLLTFSTAYRLMVNDELIAFGGIVGTSPDAALPEYNPGTVSFKSDSRDFEIIIQIANYTYSRGGFWHSLYMGTDEQIRAMKENADRREMFLFGVIVIMIVYHAAMYWLLKRNRPTLYMVLTLFVIGVRILFTGEYYIARIIPALDFQWIIFVEYMTIYWGPAMWILFIQSLYPDEFSQKVSRAFIFAAVLFTMFTVVAPVRAYTSYLAVPEGLALIVFLYAAYCVFLAVLRNREGAAVMLLSIILVLLTFANDVFYFRNTIDSLPGGMIGIATFVAVFIQAYVLAARFSKAFDELEKLSEKMILMDRHKDEFLINTAHELRTPLNGMITIAESVVGGAKGDINAQQKQDLGLVIESGKRLSKLINDILDFESMRSGELCLSKGYFNIESVIESLAREFEFVTAGKKITVRAEVSSGIPKIYADKYRVIQAIYNLMGNAVKFTPGGGLVTVKVCAEKNNLCIRVRDTGIGIPEDRLEDIFKPFSQVNAPRYGGMGLGLSISRQIARAHGGDIRVRSFLGEGSEFEFYIPIVDDNSKAAEESGQSVRINERKEQLFPRLDMKGERNDTVVIIDDNYANIAGVAGILKTEGYSVKGFVNPAEGLEELFANKNTVLAVVDLMMPEMSGYEICRKIRERYTLYEMPVIVLTARTQMDAVVRSFKEGANDILHKPFDAEELKARINTLCSMKAATEAAVARETAMLQSQIKPHFLFNTLNSVISLCYTDGQRAGEMLEKLSHYLKHSFEISDNSSLISIERELKHVKCFVEIQKERFGDRLKMEYDVDQEALPLKIIPFVIEPLVENAIRHGALKNKQGGSVRLSVKKAGEKVLVVVEDNGKGISGREIDRIEKYCEREKGLDEGSGVGLVNINRRLKRFYNEKLKFETGKEGTKVFFAVPAQADAEEGEDD